MSWLCGLAWVAGTMNCGWLKEYGGGGQKVNCGGKPCVGWSGPPTVELGRLMVTRGNLPPVASHFLTRKTSPLW